MTPERQALVDRIDEWGEQHRLDMAEAEVVEPDEQVRSMGQAGLSFAEWALAVTRLGDYDREHPEEGTP
jgi:hypothetical protein